MGRKVGYLDKAKVSARMGQSGPEGEDLRVIKVFSISEADMPTKTTLVLGNVPRHLGLGGFEIFANLCCLDRQALDQFHHQRVYLQHRFAIRIPDWFMG